MQPLQSKTLTHVFDQPIEDLQVLKDTARDYAIRHLQNEDQFIGNVMDMEGDEVEELALKALREEDSTAAMMASAWHILALPHEAYAGTNEALKLRLGLLALRVPSNRYQMGVFVSNVPDRSLYDTLVGTEYAEKYLIHAAYYVLNNPKKDHGEYATFSTE